MKKRMLAPSLLSANFGQLDREVQMLNASACDWFHLDVMDGVFVPNISFGFPVMKAIAARAEKPLDVHLMIVEPQKFISEVKSLGTYLMTVHQEACLHLHRVLSQIREAGMKAGVSLNPSTPLASIEEVLPVTDVVLLMSVNPGFGGQRFIPEVLDKTRRLRRMIDERGFSTLIQVDGGVTADNAAALFDAGADVLVAGSAVFGAPDPSQAICRLKGLE